MPNLETVSQEAVYATKGNIAVPVLPNVTAAGVAAAAQSRLNDQYSQQLKVTGQTDITTTVSATDVHIANP